MHEENGVKFYLSAGVKEIVGGEEGRVTGVTLPSGETLEADIVIAGVGKLSTSPSQAKYLHSPLPPPPHSPPPQPPSFFKPLLPPSGVVPATDFLKDSDVPMSQRGEVIVDEVR